jgi:heme exporter protein A
MPSVSSDYQSCQPLAARALSCEKQDRWLFEGLSFQVQPGEVLHVTGTNGSGKTTLLRILCGLCDVDRGDVTWGGRAITEQRDNYYPQLCYVGHQDAVKRDLTVRENLHMAASLAGSVGVSHQIDQAMQQMRLTPFADRFCRTLSAGQKRRVALSRCLISHASIWVLDEPFTSLDRDGIETVLAMLQQHLTKKGLAIITSHQPIDLPNTRTLELN